MPGAGQLRVPVQFAARGLDLNGDRLGPWAFLAQAPARIQLLKGSDPVIAARLQGVQPVLITVRFDVYTRQIDTGCRATNQRTGAVYEPITAVAPDERNAWIEILASWKVGQVNG